MNAEVWKDIEGYEEIYQVSNLGRVKSLPRKLWNGSCCGAKMVEPQETETWNGIHAQLTAPKGTFERIFNEADDDSDI